MLGIIVFEQPNDKEFEAFLIIALQLLRESYTVFPDSTTIEFRPLQPRKANVPMLVTLFGIVTEGRLAQPEKA